MSEPATVPALASPLPVTRPAGACPRASLAPAALRAYHSGRQAFLTAEYEKWGQVARDARLQPD
ncbi:hypothetical protein [Roseicella sp. DB1501]|uniref:hypothetical protein n=1 Tax=Roseicella sp. DB1501 TaxID=2730925 RepID=UPI001490C9B8|nr:hypothetical protein [Roseicella sp. DB1501]NOG69026.1 hypothetical protein [Roseicella sp. DB1501]